MFEEKTVLKRALIAGGAVLVTLAAVFSLRFVPFDNDISVMLPRDPEIARTFRFFREAPFSSNVFLSFELKDGSAQELIAAVDKFTEGIQSPLVSKITTGANAGDSLRDVQEFTRLSPQLADEAKLKETGSKLTPEYVREKLKSLYRLSLHPGGAWMLPVAMEDPLGFHGEELKNFKSLMTGTDYDVQLVDGHLFSRDGRHAMAVIETQVSVTDGEKSRELMKELESLRARLPENVTVDFVAAHLHSISNEDRIKRDIVVSTSATAVVFVLLFIFLFKDVRAILLFVTPSISVLVSIPVCALILGKLSYIIMGMGAVISGIAVDYCIHVYVAMQSGQVRKDAVKEIAGPVISSALTTAGAYAVFLFSGVPGYRQLALFTVVSTVLSLALALYIFPYFLKSSSKGVGYEGRNFLRQIPASWDGIVTGFWIFALLACMASVPFVHFRTDVKQYDGSDKKIFQTEEKFREVWGGKSRPALLAIEAKTFDSALETARALQPAAENALGENSLNGLAKVWPSQKERLQNLERWNAYWTDEKIQKLRELLKNEGTTYGFSAAAFETFLKQLHLKKEDVEAFDQIGLLQHLRSRYAFQTPRGWELVSYFTDDEKSLETVSRMIQKYPGASIISTKRFEALLSQKTLKEALYLSIAIAVILPVLAFIFLKSSRQVLISLIPVATSIFAILAMLGGYNLNLNVASLVALMVVGGFSIDYGTFVIHQNEHDLKTNTYLGVSMSALTAFCGAGALVFAKHPVLFAYGTTMVCGVAAGYLAAVFVVPSVYRLTRKPKQALLHS